MSNRTINLKMGLRPVPTSKAKKDKPKMIGEATRTKPLKKPK